MSRTSVSLTRYAQRGRAGASLLELALALTLISLLAAMAIPSLGRLRDAAAVRRASQSLTDALAVARDAALAGVAPVALHLDASNASIILRSDSDTIERYDFGATLGVGLRATRDSTAYGPDGLGVGAANLTVFLSRGAAAETVVVSRLGRVR